MKGIIYNFPYLLQFSTSFGDFFSYFSQKNCKYCSKASKESAVCLLCGDHLHFDCFNSIHNQNHVKSQIQVQSSCHAYTQLISDVYALKIEMIR